MSTTLCLSDLSDLFAILPQVEELPNAVLPQFTGELHCLRLDRVHPFISGNKWYKLKYHLESALAEGKRSLVSFGGAYSNHLHALAYAGYKLGLKTKGLVRGESPASLSPTLQDCQRWGMQIEWVSRHDFRSLAPMQAEARVQSLYPDAWVVPEGGESPLAMLGLAEMFSRVLESAEPNYDLVVCPVGSGTTLAGLVASTSPDAFCLGFSALKGAYDLEHRVEQLIVHEASHARWEISHDYHFGGFAKLNPRLREFISDIHARFGLLLDPVYTGKALFGLAEWVRQERIDLDSRILFVHTGGLQGWRGFGESRPVFGNNE